MTSFPDHRTRVGGTPAFICNRGRTGGGIQLELSRGLRRALVDDTGPSQPPRPTQRLAAFCAAVRQALGPPDAGKAG
jgi:phage replication-related protein YjqB (UPF0714/DUF867 family)